MNATATLPRQITVRGHPLTLVQLGYLAGGLLLAAVVCSAVAVQLDESLLRWVKSGSAILLFGAALGRRPAHPRLWWVVAALGVSAVGDLFMTSIVVVPGGLTKVIGMALFLSAYVLLTVAFWHGRRARPADLALLVPYLLVGAWLLVVLWPALGGIMPALVPVFTLGIVAMAWSGALTARRGFYSYDVSVWFAAAGAILVASDAAVAFVMFAPPPAELSVPVDVFIRLTYLVGWLLLLLAVVDPRPVLSAAPVDGPARRPLAR